MKILFYLSILILLITSCSKEFASPENTPTTVLESFWEFTDENYVYFDYKNIDWEAQKSIYAQNNLDHISDDSLYALCTTMLTTLKDGHCFLIRPNEEFSYDYTNGFEIHFDLDLISEKYLNNNFQNLGQYTFGIIQDTIGYVHYEKFRQGNFFSDVMEFFNDQKVSKIIIDLRNNGGGSPSIAQNMAGWFVNQETLVGYITHKGGKAHDDFSEKIEVTATPKSIYFDKKVNIIINRNSYSASSYFTGMVRHLPNIQLIGQITGGGGGAAAAYELPNAWVVGITSNFFLDSENQQIENGVEPDIFIENSAEDLVNETDQMLEEAINK